jgi:exonuclease I
VKLWLALAEDWNFEEEDASSQGFLTARASAGTLATAADDDEVASAMIKEDCVRSLKSLLETQNSELVHRALVIIVQLLSNKRKDVALHLMEGGIVPAMSCVAEIQNEEIQKLGKECATVLLDIVKENGLSE